VNSEPYRSRLSNSARRQLEEFPPDWPEIEWLPNGAYNGFNLNKQTADPRDGRNYATLMVAFLSPLSRGTVSLNSADMTVLPRVDPAWFTAAADRQMALQAFKRNREIWQIFVDLGVADPVEAFPGPSVQTDEEIMEWIGAAMITVYHASGTCKMGRPSDRMAVVDSNAMVIGAEGLRIVDASAFPFLPPGHPQSLVYAFAEKLADMIIHGS
jgi:choline dehydrogenase